MKVNELRVGNIVYECKKITNAGIIRIDQINKVQKIVLVDSINNEGINLSLYCSRDGDGEIETEYDFDKIEGVPLTEEWLDKFGFYRKPVPGCSDEFFVRIFEGDGELNWDKDEGLVLFIGNESINFYAIKHVHQLQNLFFALSGEELTITK